MCWHIKLDEIRNKCIRKKSRCGTSIWEMWKIRLKWFKHNNKRSLDALVRHVKNIKLLNQVKRKKDDLKIIEKKILKMIWTRIWI